MQTSGLVLDLYDDTNGDTLRSIFAAPSAVPAFIKRAHTLSHVEHSQLPDEAFALVMINGQDKLRKFACVDKGNTALSVMYFMKNAHKLPKEARQRTAENLKVACAWYDLEAPAVLTKEALGVDTALKVMSIPSVVKGTSGQIKRNLTAVNQGEAVGGISGGVGAMGAPGFTRLASANLDEMRLRSAFGKQADIIGTDTMPNSKDVTKPKPKTQAVIAKSASMRPVVDVTGLDVRGPVYEKQASLYALHGRYPLDSYEQVKRASAYFDEHMSSFSLGDRREYCLNLVKRAQALNIPVSDAARRYGGTKYASAGELAVGLESRRSATLHPVALEALDKLAAMRGILPPEAYCNYLAEFDKLANVQHLYGAHIMDPILSTYGLTKTAEEEAEDFRDVIGNLHVTGKDLQALTANTEQLSKAFGEDFCKEFRDDPVAIYKSMPVDQKKIIIRMATSVLE